MYSSDYEGLIGNKKDLAEERRVSKDSGDLKAS